MAGRRMIHDKICESRKVNSVDFYAEALWIRIITKADDNGNYWGDPRRIHTNCMLEKDSANEERTKKAVGALVAAELLQKYKADGRDYVHVADFHEYQELRTDKNCQVEHPLHPAKFGGAYVRDGLRRDTWDDRSGLHEEQKGTPQVTQHETHGEPKSPLSISSKSKEEGEGKGEVPAEPTSSGNSKSFGIRFSQITGVTLSGAKQVREQVNEFLDCCPYEVAIEALEEWVRQRGGRDRVKEKPQYAWKNFHEAHESIIAGLRAVTTTQADSYPTHEVPD